MAIFINGQKVAGRGNDGDSAYAIAVNNGYTGTSKEFNTALGNIGNIVSDAEAAAERAEAANEAAQTVQNNLANYPTTIEMNNTITTAIGGINTDVWFYGPEAPANTKLFWIDSNLTNGGLKFYVNGAWTHVPVAWQ